MVARGGVAPRDGRRACASATSCSSRPQQLARSAGVRLVPLWHADEAGVDIAVERLRRGQ